MKACFDVWILDKQERLHFVSSWYLTLFLMVFWGIHLFQISVECLDIFEVLLTHSIASVLLCNELIRFLEAFYGSGKDKALEALQEAFKAQAVKPTPMMPIL